MKVKSINILIIFNKARLQDPNQGKRLILPNIGCKVTNTGRNLPTMSSTKTKMGQENKVISFEKISNETAKGEPIFSKGLYHWIMFVIDFYSRVRSTLKMDIESFVILQVVVSHNLYELNKTGSKTYSEVEYEISNIRENKKHRKLTFASIAEVLQLPRETVRRKVLQLCKINILQFNQLEGIKLGTSYKTIYKDFVTQTTMDISILIKKWKNSGALNKLLEMEKN